jgi:ergothioneine biosynthesis protein EgtB
VQEQRWRAPLYWEERDGQPWHYTLGGMRPVDPAEPVCHLSFYEADAYARWAGARLPSEAEWEIAALSAPGSAAAGQSAGPSGGHFADRGRLHPAPAPAAGSDGDIAHPRLGQLFGECWEWTASPYVPYPGFRPAAGAVGEYNGKFMCNQLVLRGGSCATPPGHIRATYRNFFPPSARWQFSGIRLAADA